MQNLILVQSRGFTRTEIERHAVEAWQSGNYDSTILVDQHGYFDLRMLRLAGMSPVYVNLFNDEEVLRGLDQSVDHLLLFSPGSYATDPSWWRPWMTRWTPETARRYDTYRARLMPFPCARRSRGRHSAYSGPARWHPTTIWCWPSSQKNGPTRLLDRCF